MRAVQVAESAQHVRVPGPLGRHALHQAPADAFDDSANFGTPAGFWDEQISSRSYGQHSVEPRGREQVTRGFFEVKTEVSLNKMNRIIIVSTQAPPLIQSLAPSQAGRYYCATRHIV